MAGRHEPECLLCGRLVPVATADGLLRSGTGIVCRRCRVACREGRVMGERTAGEIATDEESTTMNGRCSHCAREQGIEDALRFDGMLVQLCASCLWLYANMSWLVEDQPAVDCTLGATTCVQ